MSLSIKSVAVLVGATGALVLAIFFLQSSNVHARERSTSGLRKPILAKKPTEATIPTTPANSQKLLGPAPIKLRLPPDDSVWASHAAELRNRAEDGDKAATVSLYEESLECWQYHNTLDAASAYVEDRRVVESAKSNSSDFKRKYDELGRVGKSIDSASTLCSGSNRMSVAVTFNQSLLRAAKQGYFPAQKCYLAGPYVSNLTDSRYSQVLRNQYRHYAPAFMARALEKGDPLAAQLAAAQLSPDTIRYPDDLRNEVPPPDPLLTWRDMRLVFYRVKPEQRASVGFLLSGIASKCELSQSDMKHADRWAQSMYKSQYTNAAPYDVESGQACR